MANGAAIRSGLANLMQDHLSTKIVNTILNIMPLAYALTARDGNKSGGINKEAGSTGIYGLGRYGTGSILSGLPLSKPRREEILSSDKYMPIIQKLLPAASDGKVMGQRDSLPKRSGWDVNYPAQYVTRPYFKWVERADPIEVPKKDIRRTKTKYGKDGQGASLAIGDMFKFESESVLSTHMQWWNQHFWGTDTTATGTTDPTAHGPSNVDAEVWDDLYSLGASCKDSNVYAGLDRGVTANAFWKGSYVTTAKPAVLEDIINFVNYQLPNGGLAKKGNGVNLILCGASLFPQFWSEAKAKGQACYSAGDGLPEMAEVGFKRAAIRFNNTIVLYDPECPDKLHANNGGTPGSVYSTNHLACLNLDTFTLAFHPDANFTVDEVFDQSRVKGGDDSLTSNIRTENIFGIEAPSMNAYLTNVG